MVQNSTVLRKDIRGVWKRVALIDGRGTEDRESVVYWVQGTKLCGDIRLHRLETSLVDSVGRGDMPFLDAFAGELVGTAGTFRWEPALSMRHRQGPPDEGRLSWFGENLREEGVHLDYVEEWTRVSLIRRGNYAVALHDPESGLSACVLHIGSFVFHACAPTADAPDRTGIREFSLFDVGPNGPQVVLSSCDPPRVACPRLRFADPSRQTVWLSDTAAGARAVPHLWRVEVFDDCDTISPLTETRRDEHIRLHSDH